MSSAVIGSVSSAAAPSRVVNKWAIAVAVATGALLEIIDTSIVNVALAEIQASVGATLEQVGWVVSSYAVANVIVLPLTAWLGDRFGKKRYFVFSLVGFTVASVLCGLATNLPMLIAARALQGLMGGGLLTKAQAILYETFPKEEQATAQGFFGAIVIAGPAIGPTLGGFIVTNVDWRWIFFVNVPIGIAAVFLCLAALPEDTGERDKSSVDWLAIALLAVGLGSMQFVLEEGNSKDWFQSPLILSCSLSAVLGLAMFVHRELTSERPVVDLRVLRHRSLWAGSLLSIVVGMALYGTLFAVPIFAQSIMQYTPQQVGILLLPSALASALGMVLASRLVRHIEPRAVLVVGGFVLAGAMLLLTGLSPQTGADDLFAALILRSVGTVMMFLPLSLATLGPIPTKDIGAASAFFNLTRQLGGSIGIALLTTLLTQRQAFHRAVLVENVVSNDPLTLQRLSSMTHTLMAQGMHFAEAQQRALAMLSRLIDQQASVLSFADTFRATGILVMLVLPLVLLLGRGTGNSKIDAGH